MGIPKIAITMGDPAGIGPEIIVKVLSMMETYDICQPLVVGSKEIIKDAVRLTHRALKINVVKRIESRPIPVTMPISLMPRARLIISVKKAQAVVRAPVIIPFPLFINVFSKASAILFPAARCSVNPDII